VGIPAWAWFVIAVVAALAGAALLLRERSQHGGSNRERNRWAALRGWQYIESDDQLLEHWAGGAIAYYPDGVARDVVIGSTFTANGRRPVYVADSVHDGNPDFVLTAVRCRRRLDAYLELWLPSVPFQRDQMPDLLGPVGQRYAFVSDVEATRSLITTDLADAAEQIGSDINVVWLEGYWVVAAAPPNASTARLERLLRDLGELADLVDPFDDVAQAAHQQQQIPSQLAGQEAHLQGSQGQGSQGQEVQPSADDTQRVSQQQLPKRQPAQQQAPQQQVPQQQNAAAQAQQQQSQQRSAQAAAQAARATQVPQASSPYDEQPTQRTQLAGTPQPRGEAEANGTGPHGKAEPPKESAADEASTELSDADEKAVDDQAAAQPSKPETGQPQGESGNSGEEKAEQQKAQQENPEQEKKDGQ
jgi:hypothetical protein